MVKSATYMQHAEIDIESIYKKMYRSENERYLRLLNRNHKVFFGTDGSIVINVNNMMPFLLYTCEYFCFFEACFKEIYSRFSDWHGKINLTRISEEFDFMNQTENKVANIEIYRNRPMVYLNATAPDYKCGVSLGGEVDSITKTDRIAMIFTDFVIAVPEIGDLVEYEEVIQVCKHIDSKLFASEIYDYSKSVYHTLEKQLVPILSGTIMNERKQRNVCPHCGGTFKGLIKQKCLTCNTPKGQ